MTTQILHDANKIYNDRMYIIYKIYNVKDVLHIGIYFNYTI